MTLLSSELIRQHRIINSLSGDRVYLGGEKLALWIVPGDPDTLMGQTTLLAPVLRQERGGAQDLWKTTSELLPQLGG